MGSLRKARREVEEMRAHRHTARPVVSSPLDAWAREVREVRELEEENVRGRSYTSRTMVPTETAAQYGARA